MTWVLSCVWVAAVALCGSGLYFYWRSQEDRDFANQIRRSLLPRSGRKGGGRIRSVQVVFSPDDEHVYIVRAIEDMRRFKLLFIPGVLILFGLIFRGIATGAWVT